MGEIRIVGPGKTREYPYPVCKKISIVHGCMVWIENSVMRVTDRHHEANRVMPNSVPSDGFFYPHHTPLIDIISCIPFGLPHLIFKVELI